MGARALHAPDARHAAISTAPSLLHLSGVQAIVAGVDHDLQLITERVQRLTGTQGIARLGAALTAARAAAAAEQREAASASGSEGEPSSPPEAGGLRGR